MVLRKIDTGAIVTRETSAPTVQTRSVEPPPATRTMRPPRQEDAEIAAPIPLTRLHTPRAPFRSAIDLPSREEPSFRETTSASLPPLVATLPPVAQPIYLPASVTGAGGRSPWGRVSLHGALAIIGAVIVLGGVAVGKHIVSDEGPGHSRSAAAALVASPPSPVTAVSVPAATAVEAVVARPQSEMEGWTPAAAVESLPRATPVAVAEQPGARAASAVQHLAPSQPAVQPPKPQPAPAAASAASALAGQASALAGSAPAATPEAPAAGTAAKEQPGDVAVHEGSKDSPATEPAQGETAPAAPAEVQEDPLMKAMRDSVNEARHR
jgi:hypothetical protein